MSTSEKSELKVISTQESSISEYIYIYIYMYIYIYIYVYK